MKIYTIDYTNIPQNLEPSSCCIGYFDGLHKGHQALIQKCVEVAKKNKIQSGLITFDPDPWRIFFPERVCKHITTLSDRMQLASCMGIDVFYVITFSKNFAALDVEAFHKLLKQMHVFSLTCGFDFKYATKNSGNVDTLKKQDDFEVNVIESINSFNEKISSSRIEPLIQSGKVDLANELLGYIYSVEGKVEHGYKRGSHLLNIPTANLHVNSDYLLPSNGVYAGYVSVEDFLYPAMINVGNNPTFENDHITLEANIFDFNQDIYGKNVRFYFFKKTRSEIKFSDFNALKSQLNQDIVTCKNVLHKDQSYLDLTLSLWHKKLFDILK